MKHFSSVLFVLILFFVVSAAENNISFVSESQANESETGDLYKRVELAAQNQIKKDSDLFFAPNGAQRRAWAQIIEDILNRRLENAAATIKKLSFPYDLKLFTDKTTKREYVLLEEKIPLQAGWGFYVFDLETQNPLAIEIAHPVADGRTELEGIDAFLQTRARAFLMAGTHRRANKKETPCSQPGTANNDSESTDYPESDVAHNTQTMFQMTHEILVNLKPETVAVQLHGMAERDVCPNAFISSGARNVTSNSKKLLECMGKNKVEAGIYEGNRDGCPLGAMTNVQGRFSNGEKKDSCNTPVKSAPEPGLFIHIEQEPDLRRDRKSWQGVIDALKCAFP
jgi:hypothetical protein